MQLKINDIKLDKRLTPRSGVDEVTVGAYANSFDQLPPVTVFWIEGRDGWWLVDGWHRNAAAKLLGLADIEAIEHQGTFEDALEFAYDANLKHGKPLTLTERKEAARLKLRWHTERSNRWIAEDCGINDKTVGELRDKLESTAEIPQLDKLEGRDGKWRSRATPKDEAEEDKAAKVEPVKLYRGDMLEVLPALGQTFDLVVADPPYGVTEYDWDVLNTERWLEAIIPCLSEQYHLFWFCSPKYAADIEMIFRELGLEIQSRIVWHRRNMAKGSHAKNRFIDTWDMIFHIGNKPLNFPSGWTDAWFDVQVHAVPQSNFDDRKLHPTQKPYSLIRRLVEFGSSKDDGDIVLDPFAGAGTTGAACQEDDRQCVLIELEEGYCGIIEGRLGIEREDAKPTV
jgi:DNA modification methylase